MLQEMMSLCQRLSRLNLSTMWLSLTPPVLRCFDAAEHCNSYMHSTRRGSLDLK